MHTKLFLDRCTLIYLGNLLYNPFIKFYTISNRNKKMTDVMKEKLNPVEEYRRINSKPK